MIVVRPSVSHQSMASNLESFTCLWLDHTVNSAEDNIKTQKELRQIINDLRTFDNSDQCEKYIRQITEQKVVLIVSGALGQQLVPRLHDLPQFSACYVFCQNKKANEEWAKKYPKVKSSIIKIQQILFHFLFFSNRSTVFLYNVLNLSLKSLKIKSIEQNPKMVLQYLYSVLTVKIFKLVMLFLCGFNYLSKFFFICTTNRLTVKNSLIFVENPMLVIINR